VHLVLDEIIDQGHQGAEKEACQDLPVLHGAVVVGAEGKTSKRPGQRCNKVRDHKNIMPAMVIGGCNVGPTTAHQCPEEPRSKNHLREGGIWSRRKDIPQEDEGKPRTGRDSDEDLEDRTFGIPVPDCRRDRGKPLIRIAIVFVLDDFVKMKMCAHNQRAEKSSKRKDRMGPGHPFPVELSDG